MLVQLETEYFRTYDQKEKQQPILTVGKCRHSKAAVIFDFTELSLVTQNNYIFYASPLNVNTRLLQPYLSKFEKYSFHLEKKLHWKHSYNQ